MRVRTLLVLALLVGVGCSSLRGERPVVVGAIYPTGGSQGSGGMEEYRGITLAAEYASQHGGFRGRPIRLELARADTSDAVPDAVDRLTAAGIRVLVGSYGSTISRPVAELSARRGLFFWETGAVGELGMETGESDHIFRFAPTGAALGRAAVIFVRDQLTPRLAQPRPLRYSVVYVNDVYGRAVAIGATAALLESHLPMAGRFPYDLREVDFDALAQRIAATGTEVLVVAAYLDDGVKLRRALVRAKVPLVANIGTSSSYCHLAFGQALGPDAVGVFASDKPDGDVLRLDRLSPEAATALQWARSEYRQRFHEAMSAPALAGFAGGWALFHHVFPKAAELTPEALARAAQGVRLAIGSLPNGGGLSFASPGGPDGGANLLASTVIWQWVKPYTRAIVWPEMFATRALIFP